MIGVCGKARGLKGEIILRGEPNELALVDEIDRVYLRRDDDLLAMTPTRIRPVKDGLAVQFEGISGRDAAEAWRGSLVEVDVRDLPSPTISWFLWGQVRGFEVVTTAGESLGRAEDRIRTGASDVFVVRAGEREVLIPASPNVLREIDPEARRIIVEVLPGLLELND